MSTEYKSDMVSDKLVPNVIKNLSEEMDQVKGASTPELSNIPDQAKQDYLESHKTELKDSDATMIPRQKHNCKKCFGRGFEGAIWTPNAGKDILLCRCIKKNVGKKLEPSEYLSYGEFQSMLDRCDKAFHLGKGKKDEVFNKDVQGTDKETT